MEKGFDLFSLFKCGHTCLLVEVALDKRERKVERGPSDVVLMNNRDVAVQSTWSIKLKNIEGFLVQEWLGGEVGCSCGFNTEQ